MFKSISWQAYLQFMAIGSGIFYCAVILLFYRQEARSLIKRILSPKQGRPLLSAVDSTPHTEVLQNKIDEVRAVLFRAGKECSKAELLAELQNCLADYDGLHISLHNDALTLFISTQAIKICGLELSDKEIKRVMPVPVL